MPAARLGLTPAGAAKDGLPQPPQASGPRRRRRFWLRLAIQNTRLAAQEIHGADRLLRRFGVHHGQDGVDLRQALGNQSRIGLPVAQVGWCAGIAVAGTAIQFSARDCSDSRYRGPW